MIARVQGEIPATSPRGQHVHYLLHAVSRDPGRTSHRPVLAPVFEVDSSTSSAAVRLVETRVPDAKYRLRQRWRQHARFLVLIYMGYSLQASMESTVMALASPFRWSLSHDGLLCFRLLLITIPTRSHALRTKRQSSLMRADSTLAFLMS